MVFDNKFMLIECYLVRFKKKIFRIDEIFSFKNYFSLVNLSTYLRFTILFVVNLYELAFICYIQ